MASSEISVVIPNSSEGLPLSYSETIRLAEKRKEKVISMVAETERTGASNLVGFTEVMPGSETILTSTGIVAAPDRDQRVIGTVFQCAYEVPDSDKEILRATSSDQKEFMLQTLTKNKDWVASIRFSGWDSSANADNPPQKLLNDKYQQMGGKKGSLLQISAPGVIGADFTLRESKGFAAETTEDMITRAENMLAYLNFHVPNFDKRAASLGGHSMSGHMLGYFVRRLIKGENLFRSKWLSQGDFSNMSLGIIAPVVAVKEVPDWIKATGVDLESHLSLLQDPLLKALSATSPGLQRALMNTDRSILDRTGKSFSGWRIDRFVDDHSLDVEETRAIYTFNLISNFDAVRAQSNTLSAMRTIIGDHTLGLVDPAKLENVALVAPLKDKVLTSDPQRIYFEALLGVKLAPGVAIPPNFIVDAESGHCPSRRHWEKYFDWLVPRLIDKQKKLSI